ncbi:Alpha/Beta hydrolase protein [Xylariaceae sp. FL0255]|nr:Alpha/Beta hydrolase protein [Xylariaceae sp. FL0255]
MPFFNHDRANLFYIVEGTGPAILLIHGWTCDLLDWQYQVPYLQSLGYQTIAFDARGHGASSIPPKNDPEQLSAETAADDAIALLTHLKVTSAILISHSAGALTASVMAVRAPDVVRANIMIDPEHYHDEKACIEFAAALAGDAHAVVTNALSRSYSQTTPEWLKTWHRHRILRTPAHVISESQRIKTGTKGALGIWEVAQVWMRERKGPRLVVLRDETNLEKERSLGLSDKDRVVVFEGSGHWMHILEVDRFHALLKDWLATVL